jgi:hypothetical protein
MRATKTLIDIQRDTLVEVIQWLDSNRFSDEPIREAVDRALNGSTMDSIRRNSTREIDNVN